MRKKAIVVTALATGILTCVLGQQVLTSAAVAAPSVVAQHYVVAKHYAVAQHYVVAQQYVVADHVEAAAPAGTSPAGTPANTSLQFTVGTSGNLTITVPASAYLGAANPGTTTAPTPVGTVTVTDTRSAATADWTTTASSTDLTTTSGSGFTIPAANMAYDPGTVSVDFGTVTPTGAPVTMSNLAQAVVSVTGSGNNTVSWNPTLAITVPPAAISGAYTGTLTHSVA